MNRYLLLITLLAILCSCSTKKPRLVIIHTNDTHAHYEPLRSGEYAGLGGVVERAAFIDSVHTAMGSHKVLLVHCGDFSQGSIYFSELDGQFEPKIINDLGYDCITLGNHEFDNNLEQLTDRLSQLTHTKVVSSNIDINQFELSKYVKPYTIIHRGGMKIGLFGLAPNLKANVPAVVSSRFEQLDNVEVSNRIAAELKAQGCDMVILLSHLGMDGDVELIPKTKNIDLVIGGHSHTFIDELVYVEDKSGHKVPITTNGCWGLEMGLVKVW